MGWGRGGDTKVITFCLASEFHLLLDQNILKTLMIKKSLE